MDRNDLISLGRGGEDRSGPPLVGICATDERVSWGAWYRYPVSMAPHAYVTSLQRVGAVGIVLPPDDVVTADPDLLLDRIDALILTGGADIDPATYGAEPHRETKGTSPQRDRFEVALTQRALDRDMPVLGVCRGMQLLNVALGGTIDQHLPESLGSELHRTIAGVFGPHEVRLDPESLVCEAEGAEMVVALSHHHQGVDRVGDGLRVCGWSVEDDLVEAIELPDKRFAIGVVWHPEEDEESHLIGALVEAAGGARAAASGSPQAA
jgi:putative glutamine amidotransferase